MTREPVPAVLTEAAREIWRAVVPHLPECAVVDLGHVVRACRLEALGQQALARAEAGGATYCIPPGVEAVSPHVTVALRCFEAADKVWFRFGVTPGERHRLWASSQVAKKEKPRSKWQGLVAVST